jgi:leader peptidase (prepilin peptidase)/N-methyltransferase
MILFPAVLLTGWINDFILNRLYRPKRYPATAAVTVPVCVILCHITDNFYLAVKGCIFAQLLIAAGYIDAKTQEIPDEIPLALLLDGLILIDFRQALPGLFTVSLPLYLLGLLFTTSVEEKPGTPKTPKCTGNPEANDAGRTSGTKEDRGRDNTVRQSGVGGGDIKLMAACGWILGPCGVAVGAFFSFLVLIPAYLFQWTKGKRHKMNAMAPYFAAGCLFAFFLEFKR